MFDAPPWPPSDPTTALACTIWMEARGDGLEGMSAVANVVLNRACHPRWWGEDVVSVCLAPYQFSSWNEGSTEIPLVQVALSGRDPTYSTAYNIAHAVLSGILLDNTENADSYYDPDEIDPPPTWAIPSQFTKKIGRQKFYRTELPPLV